MFTKRVLSITLVAGAILLAVGISLWFTGTARARLQTQPQNSVTIPYPGHLTDESGQTVMDGLYDFTFALFNTETGGRPLWTELKEDILVQDGAFATLLGSASPLPQETLDGSMRWLEVAVRGPGEFEFTLLSPRQELSAILSIDSASSSNGSACPHDHLTEEWQGTYLDWGLRVVNNWGYGPALVGAGYYSPGVLGASVMGPGVRGYSGYGPAIAAEGTGVISSTAESFLYLSPHDMAIRESDPSVVNLTLLNNGGVRVRNMTGSSVTRYLSMPASTFGTLFGAQVYVKSIEVCYKSGTSLAFIDTTGVYKNSGSDGTWSTYLQDTNKQSSTTYTCYEANATTPLQPVNNSTWVQFNIVFSGNGSPWEIFVYTVKLTLTEIVD